MSIGTDYTIAYVDNLLLHHQELNQTMIVIVIEMRQVSIQGKVTKYSSQKKEFSLYLLDSRKTIRCVHDYEFLPLMLGDAVSAEGCYDEEVVSVTEYPMVVPGTDEDTMVSYITVGTSGKISGKRAMSIYKDINDSTEGFSEYMADISCLFSKTRDIDLASKLDMEISEKAGLLSWWHRKVNLRKLWLFGLSKSDLKKIQLDPTEIYDRCMKDPFTVVELPIEKCKRILKQTSNTVTRDQITRGLIARYIYKNGFSGWCGTPIASVRKDYVETDKNLEGLMSDYSIVLDMNTLYLPNQYKSEVRVARGFEDRIGWRKKLEIEPSYKLETLTDGQKEAIRIALEEGISIITGFAGSGKSSVINEISHNLTLMDKNHAIGSFTGKAVARLKEVTGKESPATLDKMIMKKDKYSSFSHLIIDEASMVTTELMSRVLEAFPHTYKITLVGDENQLEPIGWGSMFSQAIKSGKIRVCRLNINHRSKNDGISTMSTAVVRCPLGKGFTFSSLGNFFVQEGNLAHIKAILRGMRSRGVDITNITTITPYNKWVKDINNAHREVIGVDPSDFDGWVEGDRVMVTENNYDINVMNGEEGIITGVSPDYITVVFKNGKEHDFTIKKKGMRYRSRVVTTGILIHSFCITIHRAQGSEWDYVIVYIPEHGSNSSFLTRNLVYTSITRGRSCVWIIGKIDYFNKAVSKEAAYRHDNLSGRLNQQVLL